MANIAPAVTIDDDTRELDLPRWALPSGRYAVRKISDGNGTAMRSDPRWPRCATARKLIALGRSSNSIAAKLRLSVLAPVR